MYQFGSKKDSLSKIRSRKCICLCQIKKKLASIRLLSCQEMSIWLSCRTSTSTSKKYVSSRYFWDFPQDFPCTVGTTKVLVRKHCESIGKKVGILLKTGNFPCQRVSWMTSLHNVLVFLQGQIFGKDFQSQGNYCTVFSTHLHSICMMYVPVQ